MSGICSQWHDTYCANCDALFRNALYFDCRDAEEYTHSSPEEALEEYFDLHYDKDVPIIDLIAKHAPITMTGYDREPVSEAWMQGTAESLHESLEEIFGEEFGDPDGQWLQHRERADDNGAGAKVRATLIDAVRAAVASWDVWRCVAVGKKEYSAEEIEAVLREQCPEWFEKEDAE
jgi:hypothetical protein